MAEPNRSSYSFARRPIWVAGLAIAVGMAVLFVLLGLWQLRRHDERRDLAAVVTAQLARPPDLLSSVDVSDPDGARYRRVEVTGRFVAGDQVLVRNRSFRGSSGYHVVVPLVTEQGAVLVDRGFVALAAGDSGDFLAPPPGIVTVDGILLETEERGAFGPRDPEEGRLEILSRVDVGRMQQQVSVAVLPMYVLLQDQVPGLRDGDPLVADAPDPGRGRHFGYALQWFLFAAIAVGGFALLVWRTASRPGRGAPDRPRPRLRSP